MSTGDKSHMQVNGVRGNYGQGACLLDAKSTAADPGTHILVGPWVDISTLKNATAQVDATGLTGTIHIEGTNKPQPTSSDSGYDLCTAATGSGLSQLTPLPVRWVRARVTGFTAGSAVVQLQGVA